MVGLVGLVECGGTWLVANGVKPKAELRWYTQSVTKSIPERAATSRSATAGTLHGWSSNFVRGHVSPGRGQPRSRNPRESGFSARDSKTGLSKACSSQGTTDLRILTDDFHFQKDQLFLMILDYSQSKIGQILLTVQPFKVWYPPKSHFRYSQTTERLHQ